MPFNINQTRSPADLVQEGIDFAESLVGGVKSAGMSPIYIGQSEFVPPPGSRAPKGLRTVTVSSSQAAANSGNFFKFIMGFHGEKPYIYEKETYQQTTPGFLPVNTDPSKRFTYYQFDRSENPSAVLSPIQHIFSLVAGTVVGRPGGMTDIDEVQEMSLEKRWRTSRAFGATLGLDREDVRIAGLPYMIKSGESSARELVDAMSGGPVIGLQNVDRDVYNIESIMENSARADASAGKIPGLARDIYGLDTISETHRLTTAETIGVRTSSGGISSFTNTPTKAAQIGKRPYNPMMVFSGRRAYEVPENEAYRNQTAVFERDDPIGKQLVMSTIIPTIGGEGSRASGSSHFQAPAGLLKSVRGFGKGAMLEATFRSIIDLPIEAKNPEDLFYATESGEQRLRIQLSNEFTQTGLEKRNVIKSASTFRVAELLGINQGNLKRTPLTATTKQRHVAIEGVMATLPLEWADNPEQRTFLENTLIPALQKQGINQIEYRPTEADKNGLREVSLGLRVRQGEPMALKNFTKVTNSPLPRDMMGLWRRGEGDKLSLEGATDAVVPFKSPEGAIWSRFSVISPAEQKLMLYAVAGKNVLPKKAVNEYYKNLPAGSPAVLGDIAPLLGQESSIHLLETMTTNILGRKNIVTQVDRKGAVHIDQDVAAQQRAQYNKYGIGRDYGFSPIGEFTETTKKDFIEGAIRNLVKQPDSKISKAEAKRLVEAAYVFKSGATLEGGKQLYEGYELQEVIRAKEMGYNPVAEMSGQAREKHGQINEILGATGNSNLVRFRQMTRQEMGSTQEALYDLGAADSAIKQNNARPGAYIHIGDEATDREARTLNRRDFSSLVSLLSASSTGTADVLSGLKKELANKFGDEFGLEFSVGDKRAYLPKIETIQRLDSNTTEILTGEDSEVRTESLARLPERFLNIAQAFGSGDELDFEYAVNKFNKLSNVYMKSENLEKTQFGIYSPYETNTLLEPGELYLSRQAQERYFNIMGGDKFNTAQFQKFFNMFMGGAVGVGQRQPLISQIPGKGRYGSTAPFSLLTKENSLVGAHIAQNEAASGIRSMDLIASPGQAGMLGDSDADKIGLYIGIGRALGDPEKFLSALGGMNAEEKFQYTKKILAEQRPEVQEKAMEYMMGGGAPSALALEKNPTLANQMSYMLQLSGKAPNTGLWAKSPYHNVDAQWAKITEHASGQKGLAMGGTHNQLIRRLQAAGTAMNLEPNAYLTAMTSIGTKFSQLAVDQAYKSQTLVKVLQNAFLGVSGGGTSLEVVIDKSKNLTGASQLLNGIRWNKDSSFGNVVGTIGSILMENDDLSPRALAQLLGTQSNTRSARLPEEQSLSVGEQQLNEWESLIPEMESMQKMGFLARTERMGQLVQEGKIGENSLLGIGLKTRLAEQFDKKQSSTRQKDIERVEKIRKTAGVAGLNIDEELYSNTISSSRSLYQIFKGDKDGPIGDWKDPAQFAGMAYNWAKQGLQGNAAVQEAMRGIGSMHGIAFQPVQGGGFQVVSTNTGAVINSNASLKAFQNTIRSAPKYDQYDPNNDPRVPGATGQVGAVPQSNAQASSALDNVAQLGLLAGDPSIVGSRGSRGTGVPGGPSGPGGVPPSYPPTSSPYIEPPSGGGRSSGVNGPAFYAQSKAPSAQEVSFMAEQFKKEYHEFIRNDLSTLVNFGTSATEGALGARSNKATASERYVDLMGMGNYQRVMTPYFIRNNPEMAGALARLRRMKEYAPYAWERFGINSGEGVYAGLMFGNADAIERYNQAGGLDGPDPVADAFNFLSIKAPKERKRQLAEDQARYLAQNRADLNVMAASHDYLKYGSPKESQILATKLREQAQAKEETALSDLEKFEDVNMIPDNLRLSGIARANQGVSMDHWKFSDDFQNRKTLLSQDKGLSEKGIIPLITAYEHAQKTSSDSVAKEKALSGISERAQFSSEGFATEKLTKFALALNDVTKGTNEYLKTLNLSDKEMKAFVKSVKDGTEANTVIKEIAKERQRSSKGAIREMLAESGLPIDTSEFLTDAEIQAATKTPSGLAELKRYREASGTVTDIEKEEQTREGRGLGDRLGGALRKVAGGFGLMYLRSMWGIISNAGNFGYEESVATQQGVDKALAGAWGTDFTGYNQQANLFGAKALYAGGGKRALDMLTEQGLRERPGLVGLGQSLVAGMGGLATTAWALPAFGVAEAVAGPVGLGVGAVAALGSAALTTWGRATDQTSYVAANYEKYQQGEGKIGQNALMSDTRPRAIPGLLQASIFSKGITDTSAVGRGWDLNLTLPEEAMLYWGKIQQAFTGKENKFQENMKENARLGMLASEAEAMYSSGKATSNQDALKKMGVSKEDQFALERIWSYAFTASNMPGVSTEGRIAAVNTWETAGGTVGKKDYATLEGIGHAADLGVDLGSINQMFYTAIGAQYSPDRTALLSGLASSGATLQDFQKMQSLGQIGQNLGVGWTKAAYGKTPEEVEQWLLGEERWNPYTREMERVSTLTPEAEALAGAMVSENQGVVGAFLQAQEYARRVGIDFEGLKPGQIQESDTKLTQEERIVRESQLGRYNTGMGALAQWTQKTGRSTTSLAKYWDQLSQTGTLAQQDQYLNLLNTPSPTNFGSYVAQMTPGAAAGWNTTMLPAVAGQVSVPQSALSFTGVDQMSGMVTGRPWGQASLALPGQSAIQVANTIWQGAGGYQAAGGAAQGAINSMVNGMTVGGQTYYGQQGLQAWQNQFSYNTAMAQVGVQLKQIALSEAFTTGQGLSAYGLGETGGFWGIEDRSRELNRRQQDASFENQEWSMNFQKRQLALSEKYYGQNLALQKTQRTVQRGWTQQDWAYQENVRDLQWGWKQEDFQENVRFMTGRDRRLAERQMKRDTIMHDMEGEQIDKQKGRQQELWKMEDQRYNLDKKQHEESVKMQREAMAHDKQMFEQTKRFAAEERKLQDESTRLQRAYYVEQNKLQRESAGIQAHAAQVQKDLNNAMLAYNDYADKQKGYLELAAQSMQTLQTAIENLTRVLSDGSSTTPSVYGAGGHSSPREELTINLPINLNGTNIANLVARVIQ